MLDPVYPPGCSPVQDPGSHGGVGQSVIRDVWRLLGWERVSGGTRASVNGALFVLIPPHPAPGCPRAWSSPVPWSRCPRWSSVTQQQLQPVGVLPAQEGLRHSGHGCSHAGSGGRTMVCSASSSSRPWPGSPCPASSVTTQASPLCPRTTSSCPTDSLGTLSSAVGSRHWTWLPGRKRTRGRVRGAVGK